MEWILTTARVPPAGLAARAGLSATHDDGTVYLDERKGLVFAKAEIDALYDASAALERLCLDLVERVVARKMFDRLGLSPLAARLVTDSWQRQERNLIGRFDLAYVPGLPPKLLEYNAETPVMLVEAARWQALWKDAYFPADPQWNEIEARLTEAWRAFGLPRLPVHFAGAAGDAEAARTLDCLADTARAAGFETQRLTLDAIGWDGEKFLDATDRPIRSLFKLYPWAWMVEDEFGAHLADAPLQAIEPAWKMLLADKRVLALLWEMFPGHPNLLQASLEASDIGGPAVSKPALGRDGAGVKLFAGGLSAGQTGGDPEAPDPRDGPLVFQAMAPLGRLGETTLVASTWMVASQPAGLGMRAADGDLVGESARFVPHIVR